MKKAVEFVEIINGRKTVFIVSEHLNSLKGRILAPKKLEEANNRLRKYKGKPLPLSK